MRTADVIWNILKDYVDTVFFVPGGGAMYLVDALGKSGLKHVSCLHEQGAGFAAIGYAMARNGLGVCLTTSGPGATNAITPCAAAWMDSVPVLFISGQSNLHPNKKLRVRGVQAVDIVSMVEPITKVALRVGDLGNTTIEDIGVLVWKCLDKRPGPCWIDIPLNMQVADYE